MSSLFSGLNTARSGLMASQAALNVASQNISNASTTGYCRQSVDLTSMGPDIGGYRLAQTNASVGYGVNSNHISQARDLFLDARYRDANETDSDHKKQMSELSQIEKDFSEFSTGKDSTLYGLGGQLNSLITDLGKYQSTNSDSMAMQIKTASSSVCSTIRTIANSLDAIADNEKSELGIIINGGSGSGSTDGGVNAILDNIKELNTEISGYEVTGQKANDLRDQRNNLLDTLSGYIDIKSTEQPNGMVTVQLRNDTSGTMLVDSQNNVNKLQLDATKYDINSTDADKSVKITYANGSTAPVGGGSVNGYLKALNGNGSGSGSYGDVGIKYLKDKLNTYAQSFAKTMNETAKNDSENIVNGVKSAHDLIGTNDKSNTVTADNIDLSSAWKANDDLFSTDYKGSSIGTYALDFSKALSGSVLTEANSFTGYIANQLSSVTKLESSESTIADNLDSERQAVSSVSIDDETINIIKYQHAYSASSRVINTLDEMLDKLINSTGEVGR